MRALIVEDSPQVASRLSSILVEQGVEVGKVCETEDSALQAVERQHFDFALIDLQLAQGTGFGVVRALTKQRPLPCIVVITNHAVPALKIASFEAGADFFLDKSVDLPHTIVRLLRELMQSREHSA